MSLVCNIIRTDILHYAILKGYFSSVFTVKAFEILHNLHITMLCFLFIYFNSLECVSTAYWRPELLIVHSSSRLFIGCLSQLL